MLVTRRSRAPIALRFGALAAATAVLVPMVYLVVRSFEFGMGPIRTTLWRESTFFLTARSLGLSLAVTVTCLLVGCSAAWIVARTDLPMRRMWTVLLSLPLAVPSYVAAWAWIGLWPGLSGAIGAWLVLSSVSYPFVFLPVAAALRRSDSSIEDAARMLGRGPISTAVTITVRQARPAAVGGALLVALYVLSDFGAVSIMRFPSLTNAIFRAYRGSFDRTPAAILGCLLVVLALIIMVLQRLATRGDARRAPRSNAARPAAPFRLGWRRWPSMAFVAAIVGLSLGVPAWSLAYWIRRGSSRADWGMLADATTTSAWVALLGALATMAVALPVGILAARYPSRLSGTVVNLAYAAHALPGIVVGLSVVFFGVRYAYPIYQRVPLLIFGYVVLFLSFGVAAVQSSVSQCPVGLEEMSRMLGRSTMGTWTAITMRLSAPGLAAGMLLVFLTVMKELPATLLLRPIGLDTLATRLWGLTDASSYAAAAPFAAAIVLLSAVPAALLTGRWAEVD